ncbi:MAG: hypothetical protein KC493_12370 [Bacteriovoracaceae bacterium]|nr:hypothetical protein [Bacteriovoracaceae bacterium]
MNKLKFILLCTMALGALNSYASTEFGLFLNETVYDKSTYKKINAYFNKIDNKIKNGIRFGVDRLIEVRLEDLGEIHHDCSSENLDSFSTIENNNLVINSRLVEPILSSKARLKVNGCTQESLLIKSVDKSLLSIGDDLSRNLIRDEKKTIRVCNEAKRRGHVRRLRFNPTLKKRCDDIGKLVRKRVAFKHYEKKVRNLLYKADVVFDSTSFTEVKLQKYNICSREYTPTRITSKGKKMKMLGMALIYMAPGYTTSVAGHVAERYVYCLDGELKDIMFEYTQLTVHELEDVKYVYKKHMEGVTQDYLKSLVGANYMKVKFNPGNSTVNGYGFAQFHTNRDILEVWPKYKELEMYDGLQNSLKSFKKQGQMFKDRVPFEQYSLLNNNCTHPIRERMKKYGGGELEIDPVRGITPIWIFNFLKNKSVDKIIIYPSQRLLRKFQMMESGKSIFWENVTFWSKASKGADRGGMMMLYPESHGLLKGLITKPLAGILNLSAAVVQTTVGILQMPLKWLSKLPGFKWMAPKKPTQDNLGQGIRGIGMSLTEMVGIRLRYPSPTDWTEKELDYIYGELEHQEPKIVDYLFEKVQK